MQNEQAKHRSILVTLADLSYLEFAKQVFGGAVRTAQWRGDFGLLAHDIPPGDLAWFKERGIHIFPCPPLAPPIGRWGGAIYSKLYLFAEFFRSWKVVLFLDVDTIFSGPLMEFSLESPLQAVEVPFAPAVAWGFHVRSEPADLHAEFMHDNLLAAPVMNTGVLALRPDLLGDGIFQELVAQLSVFEKILSMPDQALLSRFFRNKWKPLPASLNILVSIVTQGIIDPALRGYVERIAWELGTIIHFSRRGDKPWTIGHRFRSEWEKNLQAAELM